MMLFSERKKLAEEYEKWVSENKDVLDCPLTVISWLVAEGYVGKIKVADLEAKLAEKELLKKQLNEQIWLCEEKQQTINEINKEFVQAVKDWKHLVKTEKTEKEQLKQQLAEKETEIKSLSSEISSLEQDLTHYKGEVYNLKDQFAEKDKEIEDIKLCRCVNCTNEYEFMLEGLVGDLERQLDKCDQDKISFALEQLEKVSKEFSMRVGITDNNIDLLNEIIDNQIGELKKGENNE